MTKCENCGAEQTNSIEEYIIVISLLLFVFTIGFLVTNEIIMVIVTQIFGENITSELIKGLYSIVMCTSGFIVIIGIIMSMFEKERER